MLNSLGNERTATLPGRYRAAVALAALVVMSAFATDTAPQAAARSADANTVTPMIPTLQASPVPHDLSPSEILTTVRAPRLPVFTRIKSGIASWYGLMLQGRLTASGRPFDMNELTAAHRSLPFGTKVKVTDLRNKRSVVVTITDRGILRPGRVIDLSLGAARELRMVQVGLDPVRLELLTYQN